MTAGSALEAYKKNLEKNSQTTTKFSKVTSTANNILGNFVSALANMATVAIASFAIEAVVNLIDDYVHEMDNAIEKTEEAQSKYSETVSELNDLNSEVEEYKETLNSLADKYEVEITGTENVSELISKLQSADLSLKDNATLEQIKAQNAELERQIKLNEKLAEQQSQEAIDEAMNTLNLERTEDTTQPYVYFSDKTPMTGYKETDIITASKNELNELERLKKERQKLLEDDIDDNSQTNDFEKIDNEIEGQTQVLSSKIEQLNTLRASFEDETTGLMKSGLNQEQQDKYTAMIDIINGFNDIDLSPAEKQLNAINSFFDESVGRNAIKDELLSIAEEGDITVESLGRMGLTLSNLGLEGSDGLAALNNYFHNLVDSANEAEDAINSVDGSVEGVNAAFESDNQDANWNTMAEHLESAAELYKQGKVGTDDFKTATQFMTYKTINPDAKGFKYDADAYEAAWKNATKKVKRYFDSEKPFDSAQNFLNDLTKEGFANKSGNEYTWTKKFKNSAEAAKELGISVEAVEVLMDDLSSYGFEFDGVERSGEQLKTYKESLEGIKTIRDSMEEGSEKKRLTDLIEGWDKELDTFDGDLTKLTKDKVIKIKFEYDLATIQQQIDELDKLWENGTRDAATGAERNVAKEQKLELLENKTKYNEKKDKGYQSSKSKINSIEDSLLHTNNEEDIKKLQEEKSAILDLQSAFEEFKLDGVERQILIANNRILFYPFR